MSEAVLFLILLAGQDDRDLGQALAQELSRRSAEQVQVMVGEPAHARLQELGLTLADLEASRRLGIQLTKHKREVVLLRVAQREAQGDRLIEAKLWFDGQYQPVTAIAGEGGNPLPNLLNAMMPLVRHKMGKQEGADGGEQAAELPLPKLVERESWHAVLTALAKKQELAVLDHYYRVQAYAALGRRSAAVEAWDAMREAHGQHYLVAAALELVPPEPAGEEAEEADAGDEPAEAGKSPAEEAEAEAEAGDEEADEPAPEDADAAQPETAQP